MGIFSFINFDQTGHNYSRVRANIANDVTSLAYSYKARVILMLVWTLTVWPFSQSKKGNGAKREIALTPFL